jgi:hypothetical protein
VAKIPLFKSNEIHCRHAEIIVGYYLWIEPLKITRIWANKLLSETKDGHC